MALEIKIPSPGESITEVDLTSWFVEDGTLVSKNQEIGEIESEKATLPLIASESGKLKILVQEGETVRVGVVVASIDTSVEVPGKPAETPVETTTETSVKAPAKEPEKTKKPDTPASDQQQVKVTPVAKQMMDQEGLSVDDIIQGLRKISAGDVKRVMQHSAGVHVPGKNMTASREEERKKISQLRKKISERLVSVKNETAMLTTFNEADMSAIMAIRKKYQETFVQKHGLKLGFMSFFAKAVTQALQQFPAVNSYLDGEEVVTPGYCDIGIAVQTDKGLMVPVIRNTELMSMAQLEQHIADMAARARKARLSIEEMSGGTFTISNGGFYGSMLSTPILNPPQSGILGMHNILERPVAIYGKVEIRPMMYIALSYDHRVIDGKDSVGFLKTVKELLEEPARLIFGEQSPEQFLLEL
ncbi:MAG: 2-oxoglutarate dehydrogenase complex dihydrolipoyllysine-residue succinyltransferase [Bacteroidales bacterium]|nr:2-oxoglutarate dehydrogenase complex dihydrolipoyllysine-residue succinyltransferase [Bacteroidales bacterium]